MSAYVRGANNSNAVSGTSVTISKPSGTVQGDVMVVLLRCASGTVTPSSGWVEITGAATSVQRWYYKVAGVSEPGSYVWGIPSTSGGSYSIVSIVDADASSPIHYSASSDLQWCGVTPAVAITAASGIALIGNGTTGSTTPIPRDGCDPVGGANPSRIMTYMPFASASEGAVRHEIFGATDAGYPSIVIIKSAAPTITPSISTANLGQTSAGVVGSTEVQWTVSGSGMGTSNLVIVPKGGVEIKNVTAGGSYSRSPLVLAPSSGSLSSTTLKIRFGTDTPPGTVFPALIMYCGVTKKTVAITGLVNISATQFPLRSVHPVALAGSRIDAYLGFLDDVSGGHQSLPTDSYHTWIDAFDIDQVVSPESGAGRRPAISARQLAGKWLRQTASIQDYQILGQVQHYDDFDQLDHIVIVSGNWTVANNILTNTHSGANGVSERRIALLTGEGGVDSGLSDFSIFAETTASIASANIGVGFVFYYKDPNNYWYMDASTDGAPGNYTREIFRVVDGVATSVGADVSVAYTLPATHKFSVSRTRAYIVYGNLAFALPGVTLADLDGPIGLMVRTKNTGESATFANVHAFSHDLDISTEWSMERVCGLAGLQPPTRTDMLMVGETSVYPGYWTDYLNVSDLDLTILLPPEARYANGGVYWLYIYLGASTPSTSTPAGVYVACPLGTNSGTMRLISPPFSYQAESIVWPPDLVRSYNWTPWELRLVWRNGFVSLWRDGRFWGSLYTGDIPVAGYVGVVGGSGVSMASMRASSFSERRDGLIFDMGSPMSSALEQVIEDRSILVVPAAQTIHYSKFDTRDDLGTWQAGIFEDQSGPNDADVVSLIRATGVEIAEALDPELAKKYGIRLAQIQTSQSRDVGDVLDRAVRALRMAKSQAGYHALSGVPRLDAEPEDKIHILYDSVDGEFSVSQGAIVNDISFQYAPGTLTMGMNTREDVDS